MATSKVINLLVGKSAKGKYPAVQGSELSVNMYRSLKVGRLEEPRKMHKQISKDYKKQEKNNLVQLVNLDLD